MIPLLLEFGRRPMLTAQSEDLEEFRTSVAKRYKAPIQRVLFAQTASVEPIKISEILAPPVQTERQPLEAGYAIHVHMAVLPSIDLWIDDQHVKTPDFNVGDICLLDLRAPLTAHVRDSLNFLRIQISRRVLDEIAYDRGEPSPGELRPVQGGVHDLILYSLSKALLARLDNYSPEDRLFADYVGLAFHAHIIRTYGFAEEFSARGGLTPWQLRRVCEMMIANITGNVPVSQLADACSLSVSYFTRSFRQTVGVPPHKWLMNERIKRAKDLMKSSAMSLPEIALACGFSDQSHLTRVFARMEGYTPGRLRRLYRG